jgi:hypothetical protein
MGDTNEEASSWEEFFYHYKYKPGVEFEIERLIDFDKHKLVITMWVPDSRVEIMPENGRWPMIRIHQTARLPRWVSEEYAKHRIRDEIRAMEDHEINEWIRYKGELVDDPHKESV